MSRTPDSLGEQGYIRRQPRSDHMRVRDVSITAKARSAFEKVWPMLHRMLLPMFDGVEEDEYRNFLGTLHKALSNIRKHEI
jgi:DNA-binding MarR family transcriptional regulator